MKKNDYIEMTNHAFEHASRVETNDSDWNSDYDNFIAGYEKAFRDEKTQLSGFVHWFNKFDKTQSILLERIDEFLNK